MEKDEIKSAFSKVKGDMIFLAEEVISIKTQINELKNLVLSLNSTISQLKSDNLDLNTLLSSKTHILNNLIDTIKPTDNPTVPREIGGLKWQNNDISTGNRGVQTDSQTYQPIVQQTEKSTLFSIPSLKGKDNISSIERNIKEASFIIDSLDRLKKDIRLKFKQLTPQEMTVFSSIYQKEELDPSKVTYKEISKSLGLSESSIRDYVQKMLNKGIPIKKQKINNKLVVLSISEDLKKLATLSTILQLRDL